MSYAEKLADNCMMSFLLSGATEEECIQAHIEKAMQAQREADAKAACGLVMEMLNYETDLPYPDKAEWAESMEQAIFNAEVKV